jgi:hypothetical protein
VSRLHRLRGNDDFFLLAEAPGQPMHYLSLCILRPAPDDDGSPAGRETSMEELIDYLGARLHLIPALRWRIKPVPMGLAHPVAFEDPDFDLARHLDVVTLQAPGGPAQLDALVEACS